MAAVDPSIPPEPHPAMQDSSNDSRFPDFGDDHIGDSNPGDIPSPFNGRLHNDDDDDTTDCCRICRGQGSPDQPLFYPCKCSGSIRYVHQDCLMEWLAHSRKKYCELCKTPFRFTKLYDQSMPATLPLPLFLRQLFWHGLSTLLRWLRYGAVVTVWLVCLPWCIRQVWRGLFWLADGSWVATGSLLNQDALRLLNASGVNVTQSGNQSAAIGSNSLSATLDNTTATNLTLQDPLLQSSNPSLFHSFIRLLTGETLVSKIIRLLFSIPPIQISSNSLHLNGASSSSTLTRPPSLLSDVKFLNNLTSSTDINNFSLDVLEGLLICLTLVTGFILVFLIREWVINQQPMLNIPDVDAAELPPAAPPARREPRPRPQPRRPRAHQMDAGQARPGHHPQADHLADNPAMPPRRAYSDDNATLPRTQEPDRPDLPPRSASLNPNNATIDETEDEYRGRAFYNAPPPPLVRGALGDAIFVQRTIEEKVADLMASLDEIETRINSQSDSADLVTSSDAPGESSAHPVQLADFDHYIDQTSQVSDDPEQAYTLLDSAPHVEPAASEHEADASTTAANEMTDPLPEADSEPTLDERSGSSAHPEATPDLPPQNQSLTEKLIDWFWHVEGDQDSPHIVQDLIGDLHAEAAFVPAGAQNGGLLPPVAQQPQPAAGAAGAADGMPEDAPQDHGPIQLEWADQNAAEDVDDLEGVFELVGMEGPLINMVQNVIFSLFLITLTMTASVWIPYVWGKLALILLAHPIAITVRAPALLLSTVADIISDLGIFTLGICGLLCSQITKLVKFLVRPVFRPLSNSIDAELFEAIALNLTKRSGTRLEKSIVGAANMATLGSDLPTFSIESHRSLLVFKAWMAEAWTTLTTTAYALYDSVSRFSWSFEEQRKWLACIAQACYDAGRFLVAAVESSLKAESFNALLKIPRSSRTRVSAEPVISSEDLLAGWSTQDKVIAILLGYTFFALAGFIFMKASRLFYGLKKDDKVPGALADSLRQASGVTKVILIIGIEMLVFPLYCGLLLDLALLPLFEDATVWSRLLFIKKAPFTGIFLHWFIGTCYMFHFALFVSMCRKMLRKGVLYFIRDPDDPTFHPVRDVLERPVSTQLGKIALSAVVYGGLAVFCLGGVVWSLGHIDGILPLRWSTAEPKLAFPIDLIFYNFLLPFIIRKFEPTKKIVALSEWWFRTCAHGLRLTHFLFGIEREDERSPDRSCRYPWSKMLGDDQDGSYVRAPASDACRIPKGQAVFLPVSEDNERLDGKPDQDKGLHGRQDERWAKIYLPAKFKTRLATFVILLWVFAAGTGVTLTIGPLVVGRFLVKLVSGSPGPVNDLYALTVGVHLYGFALVSASHVTEIRQSMGEKMQQYFSNPIKTLSSLYSALTFILGHVYMVTAFGVVLPLALSLITELYIHVPLFTFVLRLDSERGRAHGETTSSTGSVASGLSPTLFVLQTWTLGLLYMRIALRVALTYPSQQSQVALAIRSIWRQGWLRPDVKQATRAVIIPLTVACLVLLTAPLGYARLLIALSGVDDAEAQIRLYRYAYPGLMAIVLVAWGSMVLRNKIELWRIKIRDEVYLVGERLHNYIEEGKEKQEAVHSRGRFVID